MAVRTVSLSYTWEPDPVEMSAAIFRVANALEHTEVPLGFAAAETLTDIKQRFLTETAPDGTPWKQWADSYAPYAESYPNDGILRQTNELYEAATDKDAVVVRRDAVFYNSSNLPARGAWHQEGRPTRRTKGGTPNPLPKRPFLGVSDQGQTVILATFAEWFDGSINLFTTSTGRIGRQHAMQGIHPLSGHKGFVPRSTPMPSRVR